MFELKIDKDLSLAFLETSFGEDIYNLIDGHRDYMKSWLPWIDEMVSAERAEDFIRRSTIEFAENKNLNLAIIYKSKIAGIVSLNNLSSTTRVMQFGYWLGQPFQGNGIMTRACSELCRYGFENRNASKLEIRMAAKNKKSEAIAKRLGFKLEGQLRNSENLYGKLVDHLVYGLLKEEWLTQK